MSKSIFKLNTIILIGILVVLWLAKKKHPKHSLATPYQPPRTS